MRFIYQYPETNGTEGDMLDAGPLGDVAAAAERAGFDGFSLTEHPIPGARWLDRGGHQSLDPLVALSYAAAVTTRLRLLTYLVVAPYRNPFLLAKAAATVDKLSGGRLILGLGTGYQKSEYHALGVDFDERNTLFDEALDALPLHWSGKPFSYRGTHFDARDVIARPRPVQDLIPIWIGGNAKVTRRRVAERVQGWMPLMGPPELNATTRTPALSSLADVASAIGELRAAARDAGRDGDAIDVVLSYLDPTITSPAVDADRHRAAFAEIADAGVTWLVVGGATRSRSETLDFLDAFGSTYLTPAGAAA
ncbi:MAG TPA: LLM class F420-dependent oxidoreductase [Acidimicrobiales bacterium]|nr:LLM class F420-dependent oxidoreductase [Acidimicrobiales bacterium]